MLEERRQVALIFFSVTSCTLSGKTTRNPARIIKGEKGEVYDEYTIYEARLY